jgi:hypothetical protein
MVIAHSYEVFFVSGDLLSSYFRVRTRRKVDLRLTTAELRLIRLWNTNVFFEHYRQRRVNGVRFKFRRRLLKGRRGGAICK